MLSSLLLRLGLTPDVHGGGADARRNVRGIILLDHLDAGPAVLGDLIDVRTFHEPEADVGMTETVGRPAMALTVELQAFLFQNIVEHPRVAVFEDQGIRLRRVALHKPFERKDGAGHALAVAHTTLAAHLDEEDGGAGFLVLDDLDVPVLKPLGL